MRRSAFDGDKGIKARATTKAAEAHWLNVFLRLSDRLGPKASLRAGFSGDDVGTTTGPKACAPNRSRGPNMPLSAAFPPTER